MKARFFLLFVTIFTVSQFAKAESDKDYSDRRLSEAINPIKSDIRDLTEGIGNHTETIRTLTERIKRLETDVSNLQQEIDSLWNKGAKNFDDLDTKVKGTDRNANIALWISLSIVLSVCGILCLVFWPRKSKAASLNPTLSDKPKCPRCGWEHDPGATVCKNPNCKTQF